MCGTDIWASFLTSQASLIPSDQWIDSTYASDESVPLVDRYANMAIVLFANVVNYYSTSAAVSEKATRSAEVLWGELQEWYSKRPRVARPMISAPAGEATVFPVVVFGTPSASMIAREQCFENVLTGRMSLWEHYVPCRIHPLARRWRSSATRHRLY